MNSRETDDTREDRGDRGRKEQRAEDELLGGLQGGRDLKSGLASPHGRGDGER